MNKKKSIIIALVVVAIAVSIFAIVKNTSGSSICDKINKEGVPVESAVTSGKQKEYAEKMETYSTSVSNKIREEIKTGARISENYNDPVEVREIKKVSPDALEKYSKIAKVNEATCEGKGEVSINVKNATNLTLLNPNFSIAKVGSPAENKKEVNYKFKTSFETDEEASMYMLTLLSTINEAYIKEIK